MFRISSETWNNEHTLTFSFGLLFSQSFPKTGVLRPNAVSRCWKWHLLRSTEVVDIHLMRKSRWLQQHLGTGLLISMPCEGAGRVPSRYYHLCPWLSATQNYEKQISIPNSASGVQNRLSQASRTNFFEQHHLALSSCVDPVLGQSVKMSSPSSSPRQAALLT